MARITIETNDTAAVSTTGGATHVPTATSHTSSGSPGVPAELAAKAAALGAHNAGAAPSGGLQTGSAPVPFISSSMPDAGQSGSMSAGAAPGHLFGSSENP